MEIVASIISIIMIVLAAASMAIAAFLHFKDM